MKKITALMLTIILLASCKSKQAVLNEQSADEAKTTAQIVNGHYANEKSFKTLFIKADARYTDSNTSQKLSADIRIKKDEKILVSLKFLGITMAKALITPDNVSYYEKLNNTYFDGNYAMLSKWLGTDLDYNKVQNLILGKAIYNLKDDAYTAKIENGLYRLSSNSGGIMKSFLFEGSNYLLKKELISQGGLDARSLDIQYPAHREYPKAVLPAEMKIDAEQKDRVTIHIEYNTVTFDEDFSFPYDVPSGFDQVFLD
ncbi:DUF4292 domain-containing protein [Flavobacterium sp. LaA7.5]|nr:DUF4292 domain-containing protein [Flavobacterium salilacus subsp. altitudinum]